MTNFSCVIFAKDVERLSRFYEEALSATVTESETSHVVLSTDTFDVVIHAIPKAVANTITIETPAVPRSSSAIKPAFVVDSLERLSGVCDEHDAFLKPVTSAWSIRGARVLDGHDPEGNVVQFKESL